MREQGMRWTGLRVLPQLMDHLLFYQWQRMSCYADSMFWHTGAPGKHCETFPVFVRAHDGLVCIILNVCKEINVLDIYLQEKNLCFHSSSLWRDEFEITFKIQHFSSQVTVIKFPLTQDYLLLANQASPEAGGKVRGSDIIGPLVEWIAQISWSEWNCNPFSLLPARSNRSEFGRSVKRSLNYPPWAGSGTGGWQAVNCIALSLIANKGWGTNKAQEVKRLMLLEYFSVLQACFHNTRNCSFF